MLKQNATFFRQILIIIDAFILVGCFAVSYSFCSHYTRLFPFKSYFGIILLMVLIWEFLIYYFGIYESLRLKNVAEIIKIIIRSCIIGFLIFTSFELLLKILYVSRLMTACFFILSAYILVIEKLVLIYSLHEFRKKGFNSRKLLVVGTGERARRFMREVDQNQGFGLRIIGLVDNEAEWLGRNIDGHEVIGLINDIPKIVENHCVDIVVFIVPRRWINDIEDAIVYCETVGIQVSLAVDLFKMNFAHTNESNLFGLPFLNFERAPHWIGFLLIKRIMDLILSGVGLVILLPAFIFIAFLIKLDSQGSILFRQQRCGFNGRIFTLLKFRTMVDNAEDMFHAIKKHNLINGPAFKMDNDPRVTKLGMVLRKFSLDELPQLWNVFKGEMSLVGPRPPIPREVKDYDIWQRRRLSMRPGITCLWQINGRNNIKDFNSWVNLDLQYIDNWSLMLDFIILLKTIPVVVSARGAK